jgi:hypothetical protein
VKPKSAASATETMDKHMEKYNLQDQDWRPGMMKQIEEAQKKQN